MSTIRSGLTVLGIFAGLALPLAGQAVIQVPSDALDGLTTRVRIETIAADGGAPQFFRSGRISHRLHPEDGARLSVVEYFDAAGERTGRFEIRTDPKTFVLKEARYEPEGPFKRDRELRVEGIQLKSSRLLGSRDLGTVSAPMPPEISEYALGFLSAAPQQTVSLEMAGFAGAGSWRVRNEGPSPDPDPRVESSNLWVGESGTRRVWTMDHAPWLLRFEFTDPSGVRWVHQTACVETPGRRPVPDAFLCAPGGAEEGA